MFPQIMKDLSIQELQELQARNTETIQRLKESAKMHYQTALKAHTGLQKLEQCRGEEEVLQHMLHEKISHQVAAHLHTHTYTGNRIHPRPSTSKRKRNNEHGNVEEGEIL